MNKPFFQKEEIKEKHKKKKKEIEINVLGKGKDKILVVAPNYEYRDYWFIKADKYNLAEKIKELQPNKIITKGVKALNCVIGHKASVTNNIEQWEKWEIPDQEYQCFIYPDWDILYALASNRKFKLYNPDIKICNENEAIRYLYNLQSLREEIIAIDIETSGLKPHRKGHFIYTVSITQNNLFTFSFELTEKIKSLFIEVLKNKNIKKIAHNIQYEYKWCKEILKTDIENLFFDTQLVTHVLDNRRGITSLKFQTYINFGVIGYEKNIKKYIESKEKGGNEFNKIKEADINDILLYNGYDTYFTMLLYQKQKGLIDDHLQKGIDLFHEGNLELAKLSGIRFDKSVFEKNYKYLSEKVDKLHNEIMNSKEVKLWDNGEFDYDSPKQLRELLYDKCKWKPKNKTKTGQDSVDAETLENFDKRFTNNILEKRKLSKIKDTYLKQFIREAVEINGEYYIFPFFNLNNISTYRSGSQAPNFQNIPIRNKFAQEITRSCLIPRRGRQLLEVDFKQMEVSTSCCYHKDPVMIDYVINNGDMHKDLAKQLFFRTEKICTKEERQLAKGNFVFAEFYGDTARLYNDELKKIGYGKVTFGLWENMNNVTREHLKTKGIKNIYDFQQHVERIEKDFWNNKFKIYQQWKFDNWKKYKEVGYVELHTGFRCNSKLGFNQVNNIAIQGTAFHIALKTLIELNKYLRKEKFNSVIVGEIHDSIILDIDPLELKFIVRQINIILNKIREEWSWLIVPLKVDFEITGINESWDKKKELKI